MTSGAPKPVKWLGSSLSNLQECPPEVRDEVGFALFEVQRGGEPRSAKQLQGFGSSKVLEIVTRFDGDTWRTVYTVEIAGVVYVLHVFQKKSTKGIKTSQRDLALIKQRLRKAREDGESDG